MWGMLWKAVQQVMDVKPLNKGEQDQPPPLEVQLELAERWIAQLKVDIEERDRKYAEYRQQTEALKRDMEGQHEDS